MGKGQLCYCLGVWLPGKGVGCRPVVEGKFFHIRFLQSELMSLPPSAVVCLHECLPQSSFQTIFLGSLSSTRHLFQGTGPG